MHSRLAPNGFTSKPPRVESLLICLATLNIKEEQEGGFRLRVPQRAPVGISAARVLGPIQRPALAVQGLGFRWGGFFSAIC